MRRPQTSLRVSCGAALLAALLAPDTVESQESTSLDWTAVTMIGIARHSPVGSEWGIAADRDHLFVTVQLETSIVRVGPARVLFTPQLTPLVRLKHSRSATSTEPAHGTAYAAGFAPFGLALQLPLGDRIHAFGGGAVGALWFDRPVPVPAARAFNITIEWGGGIDVPVGEVQRLRLGYKFHHLSNVYSALENPGVDGHVFYAGWKLRLSAPR